MSVRVRPPVGRSTWRSLGGHDGRRFDQILEITVPCLQRDRVAGVHALQRPEERVAMTRQHDVPRFAGQGGVGEVPDGASQNRRRIPLDDHGREPQPRNLNLANRHTVDQRGRWGASSCFACSNRLCSVA